MHETFIRVLTIIPEVNLGPVALSTTNGTEIANGDGLSYNPRCLTRDLTDYSNKKWANATAIARALVP